MLHITTSSTSPHQRAYKLFSLDQIWSSLVSHCCKLLSTAWCSKPHMCVLNSCQGEHEGVATFIPRLKWTFILTDLNWYWLIIVLECVVLLPKFAWNLLFHIPYCSPQSDPGVFSCWLSHHYLHLLMEHIQSGPHEVLGAAGHCTN